MKKIIALLIFCSILVVGCAEKPLPEDLRSCNSDDDCIIVGPRGCCSCDAVINKQYQEWWSTRKVEQCSGRECEVCPPRPIGTECVDNKCRPIFE